MTDREAKVKGIIQARKMQARRLQDFAQPVWLAEAFGATTHIYTPPPNRLRRKIAAWLFAVSYYWGDKMPPWFEYRLLTWTHKIAGCFR